MCNFHVGQKVVFVDDDIRGGIGRIPRKQAEKFGVKFPIRGRVFTVRRVFVCHIGIVCILLAEINNASACANMGKKSEGGFDADRFRPIVSRGTEMGMSILRELLNKTDKSVEVIA